MALFPRHFNQLIPGDKAFFAREWLKAPLLSCLNLAPTPPRSLALRILPARNAEANPFCALKNGMSHSSKSRVTKAILRKKLKTLAILSISSIPHRLAGVQDIASFTRRF
ncbi:predicted protein [Uncinocarpus reesii 1704]|uniref:Uncharacterized protein n=1 Tax=Uncinocarpus reesii (strain UAMH 1704) TaxID=336963 RepID=C4JPI0_UNCRE|nr:uncharacterized protein UREG_03152 [Uncinocarpus reesii 1704]EEP78306.1 predicted protein [Uncinocarpus reesii 1704]